MASRKGKRVYNSAEWKRVRVAVLARDNHRCVTCGKRGVLEVNHIHEIARGGDWFDMDNLEAICRGCHIAKTREAFANPKSAARQEFRELARARA